MRVDAVITWVDGSDPLWRSKREQYSSLSHAHTLATSNVEGRFRDNGDLLFLLRSLEKYWPFEGSIYLVTDGQSPDFLSQHPRVKVIDHREILDGQYLPTFSSRAIESALHRIPGLAEHFVAFNDDVFLTRRVSHEDFFGDKGARIYLSDEKLPDLSATDNLSGHNDALNAKLWMRAHYGESKLDFIQEHSPKGVRKSWMMELEERHPDVFDEVRQEKFRRVFGQSILANLYQDWCLTLGRADVCHNECLYLYTDDIEGNKVESLQSSIDRHLSVCINDTTDNRSDLKDMLGKLNRVRLEIFPNTSAFEKKMGLQSKHQPLALDVSL